MTISELVNTFGGTVETANMIGILPSAVSNWKKRGHIPGNWHLRLIHEGKKRGIYIDSDVFVQETAA